jgi:hypothetical protein
MSFAGRALSLRGVAGFDYNIAEGHLGNADAAVTLVQPRYTASLGGRRYRPYFSLWTLWGAFSPVPYHAVYGSASVRATDRISVSGRAERYAYEPAEVSTALVRELEDRGWRTSAGVSASLTDRVRLDGHYAMEFGPGAAGRFVDGALEYMASDHIALGVYGGVLQRPLEPVVRMPAARRGGRCACAPE